MIKINNTYIWAQQVIVNNQIDSSNKIKKESKLGLYELFSIKIILKYQET